MTFMQKLGQVCTTNFTQWVESDHDGLTVYINTSDSECNFTVNHLTRSFSPDAVVEPSRPFNITFGHKGISTLVFGQKSNFANHDIVRGRQQLESLYGSRQWSSFIPDVVATPGRLIVKVYATACDQFEQDQMEIAAPKISRICGRTDGLISVLERPLHLIVDQTTQPIPDIIASHVRVEAYESTNVVDVGRLLHRFSPHAPIESITVDQYCHNVSPLAKITRKLMIALPGGMVVTFDTSHHDPIEFQDRLLDVGYRRAARTKL